MTDLDKLADSYGMVRLPNETTSRYYRRVLKFHKIRQKNKDKHPYRRAWSEKRQQEIS